MNAITHLLLYLLFIFSNDKNICQNKNQCTENCLPTVIINYVPDLLDRNFYNRQPQVEYLKIPVFPLEILSGFESYDVIEIILRVETDGKMVTSVDLVGEFDDVMGDRPGLKELLDLTIENVKAWRFREHAPTVFSTSWSYMLGEIIDESLEPESTYEIVESDIATLELPHFIEVVVFPKPDDNHLKPICRSNQSDNCGLRNQLQLEYLKIPEHAPKQLRSMSFKNDVIMKVKTDGQNVISAEAIEFVSPVYKDSSIESVKSWRFKKHTPTEFITHWKYDVESSFTSKPNIVTLNSPYEVEIKAFRVVEVDSVRVRKIMKRKK